MTSTDGKQMAKPTRFEDDTPAMDPVVRVESLIKKALSFIVAEAEKHGIDDERTLGLAIASALSAFVERRGAEDSLGFIGETLNYLEYALAHLAEQIPDSGISLGDRSHTCGIIARVGFDRVKTKAGTVAMTTQSIIRSSLGSLFLLEVSDGAARMIPITLAQAVDWVDKYCAGDAAIIISRLKAATPHPVGQNS